MERQIKAGAIISYLGIFVNIIIGIVYTPWMIRNIGKNDYGLYILASSIISIFVFDFGLAQAVTRFISRFLARRQFEKINQLLGMIYKLYLGADAIIVIILSCYYFMIPRIYAGLTAGELQKFKVVFVIAASFSMLSFPFIPLTGVLQAYELFVQLKLCDLIHKLLIVIFMTGCLLAGMGLYALILVNSFAGLVVIIIKLFVLAKLTKIKINWLYWNSTMLKCIIGFSMWITLSALAQRCVLNICPSILGYVSNSHSIAVFGVAVTIEGYVYTLTNAINGLFLPKITRLYASGDRSDVLNLMIKVGRIQLYILGLIVLGFACTGRNFILLWLGDGFKKVYICALLLIAPSFIGQTQQIAATAIVVENKVKELAFISATKAVANLVFAYPLAIVCGVYGVALSVFISDFISLLQLNLLYQRTLKINIVTFFHKTFGNMIIPMFICTILGWSINYLLPAEKWIFFISKICLFSCLYCFLMFKFVMNYFERAVLLKPFQWILNFCELHRG